ncbi:hypothetical protein DUNSADRAFT_7782 [Dunaliella salina]|uniref:Uncharacterized protein n=1 Tax=Dunaliella salina TaxID=3046 RepID=A0ABQ7GKP7_DUNSA|nr:hypothetical protein DUNSADRAFT_7782 [Dunaliella salina]|eukprot:KAF5835192.1 hypothetical protein DUNSADRAFT_7782 [Dunaliella salina]
MYSQSGQLMPYEQQLAVSESTAKFAAAIAIRKQRAAAEQRRKDRETHHHRDLWAKQPHDGPYYKVDSSSQKAAQHNQLVPDPTRQPHLRHEDLLGYEHVPHKGPTTNFVGNAMTMGAVDLIHAELKAIQQVPAGGKELEGVGNSSTPKIGKSLCTPMEAPTPTSSPPPVTSVLSQRSVQEASEGKEYDGTVAFRKLWSRLHEQGKV